VYARSTTALPSRQSIDARASPTSEVGSALQRMDGCIGLSLLVDRDPAAASPPARGIRRPRRGRPSGRSVDSCPRDRHPGRHRACRGMGNPRHAPRPPSHPGAWARATWLCGDPSVTYGYPPAIDRAVDVYKMAARLSAATASRPSPFAPRAARKPAPRCSKCANSNWPLPICGSPKWPEPAVQEARSDANRD
jgi:hypothetical protein